MIIFCKGSTDSSSKLDDIVTAVQCVISTVKIIKKSPEGARLFWKPPQSKAREITEYSVTLAVKGSSSSQSVESLSRTRVYCGSSVWFGSYRYDQYFVHWIGSKPIQKQTPVAGLEGPVVKMEPIESSSIKSEPKAKGESADYGDLLHSR